MPRSERLPTYTEAHTHTWSLLAEGPALNVGAGADWSELSERCWLSVLLALDVRSQLSGYLIIIHILSTFIIKHFLIAGHKHTNCIDRFKLQSFINLTCNCKSWEILRSSVTEIRAAGVCLNQIWLIFDFTSVPLHQHGELPAGACQGDHSVLHHGHREVPHCPDPAGPSPAILLRPLPALQPVVRNIERE